MAMIIVQTLWTSFAVFVQGALVVCLIFFLLILIADYVQIEKAECTSDILGRSFLNKTVRCVMFEILVQMHAIIRTPPGCSDGENIGSLCFFDCQPHYALSNNDLNGFSVCTSSGNWYPPIPNCIAQSACPDPDLPEGMTLLGLCSKEEGTACDVNCQEQLTLHGPAVIMCNTDRQWKKFPYCGCPFPKIPEHGIVQYPCDTKVGSFCVIHCLPGYEIKGYSTIICQKNGTWTDIPSCEEACPELNLPLKTHIIGSCPKSVNSTCQIECDDQLILTGNETITCTSEGSWSHIPSCGCKTPVIAFGSIEIGCDFRLFSECKVICNANYTVLGNDKIQCLSSGNWSPNPECAPSNLIFNEIMDSQFCPSEHNFYNNQCYKIYPKEDGIDAITVCQSPSHGLVIRDNVTYNFIIATMIHYKAPCIWTGVTDIQQEGVWRDSLGEITKFLPWDNGEPSPYDSDLAHFQDCVMMSVWDKFKYHDYNCYHVKCLHICQRDTII